MAEMDQRFQQILSWQQMDQSKAISHILQEVSSCPGPDYNQPPVGPRDLMTLETWEPEPPGIALWSFPPPWGHASHPDREFNLRTLCPEVTDPAQGAGQGLCLCFRMHTVALTHCLCLRLRRCQAEPEMDQTRALL